MVLDQAKIVNTDTLNLYIHICKRMNIEEVVKIPKELAALIKDDHYYCYWQLRTIEEFLLPDKKNERQNNNNDVYDHGGDQFKKKNFQETKKILPTIIIVNICIFNQKKKMETKIEKGNSVCV